jgi:hypothetical protein
VAGEISRHKMHTGEHGHDGSGHDGEGHDGEGHDGTDECVRQHDRVLSIIEAVLLSIVALLAAYTGYASAKWSTKSSIRLATASAARTEANRTDANRAALDAQDLKHFDSTTFNAWFTAYVAGNTSADTMPERRFRPAFAVAFNAQIATDPFVNASTPPGATYMPQYKQPELAEAAALDAKATSEYTAGVQAGADSDNYVRGTIYLAAILFLIGISGHFRFFRIGLGLVILGGMMLAVAVVQIASSPPIP